MDYEDEGRELTPWEEATGARSRTPYEPHSAMWLSLELRPADPTWLEHRLALMMEAHGSERDPHKVTAWLHETTRLLADLPQDVLDWAIDEGLKQSPRGFLPSVGEIRAHAQPQVDRRKHRRRMEREYPAPYERLEAPAQCKPEEAAAIIQEVCPQFAERNGTTRPNGKPLHMGPPRKPTRQDYIDLGVDPAVLDGAS